MDAWRKLRFYLPCMWRFAVLRRPVPLFYGIAITDRCNLSCRGCHVSNTGRADLSWQLLVAILQDAFRRGFRELYFTGGEPMLWRDGCRSLADAVTEARRIGFFHVHVYTNGTLGLHIPADLLWVSMDGLPETFATRRGPNFTSVERAIRAGGHPKTAIIYVIDRNTAPGIETFLEWVKETDFPVIGVMFYFHTPYYGWDSLFMSGPERRLVIERLLAYSRRGLPVLNSRAGLRALYSGDWPRRSRMARVADIDGESVCCRASDETCQECGYAAAAEIAQAQRLRPSALLGMARYW